MVTKQIVVCDWHDEDTPATHHNEWTDLEGKRKENDLCDTHQKPFLKAWESIDKGSNPSTKAAPVVRPSKKKPPKGTHTPNAQARAWAKSQGMEVNDNGRVGFHVESAWKKAGSPNVLENSQG
ncbi:Lsr2 family DNA-binding protein [Streptosporangium subroseum]|uniref:Lsr2 family DNA-binding protein n=1 Tax=Streptosporangium subroseum TaxID=106412 RepID=UPI00308E2FDA|nr:Lsr2 family protein [Streptosporangium subroseum]